MNNQNQPGTQGYIQSGAQSAPSKAMSAQYSQEAGFFGALDAKTARNQGKKLAREALAGFESVLKEADVLDSMLQKSIKSMEIFKSEAKLTGEALKEHNAHYKELTKSQDKLSKIQASISQEMQKASPDEKKILDLEIKRVEAQAQAEKLITQTALQKRVEVQMMEKENILKDKSVGYEEKIEQANRKIFGLKQDINDIEVNNNSQYDEYLEKLEKSKKLLEESGKTLKESMANFRNTVSNVFGIIDDMWDAVDPSKRIDRWTLELDQFTKDTYQLANVWGTDYGQGFQSFKNSLMSEINSDNAFNPTQLNSAMKDLSQITFESKEAMMGMARDFTYAKEYMGMQNETLSEIYGMQLKTNDNTFFKKTMETVIGLQKSGIQVSEEQLNQTIKSSMTLSDALTANGMSYQDVAEFQSSMTEAMTVADATMGKGSGEALKSMIENTVTGGIEGMAELGPTALQGYMKVLNGQGDANDLIDAFMNSEAGNVYGNIYKGGPSWGTTLIGSGEVQFGGLNAGLYRNYQNNFGDYSKATEDLNKTTKDQIKMEERITEILDRLPDAYKTANGMAEAQLAADWQMISEQEENRKFWEATKSEILTVIGALIGVITTVHTAAVISNTVALNTNTLAQGSKTLSNLGTKGLGKLTSFGTAKGTLGGAISGKLGGGALGKTAGVAANGLVVAGGVLAAYDMAKTGIDVGKSGFVGTDGQRIEGTGGFGDGMAAAFAGSKVKDSTVGNVGGGALSGGLKGAAIGAAVGTVFPVIGTAIGAAVGGAIGVVGGIVGGIRKDNARKAEEERKLMEAQLERQKEMVSNTKELQGLRDAVLMDRYSDMRTGPTGGPTLHSEVHPPRVVKALGGATAGGAEDPYRGGSKKNGTLSAHDATDNNTKYKGIPLNPFSFTSRYGWRSYKGISWHSGIDFSKYQSLTQPIGSAFDGEVVGLVTGNDPVGNKANYVAVYHPGQGVTSLYYHLSKAADGLKVGDQVKAGNIIGYQGSSGESTGPHLHYQVNRGEGIKWGQDIDPGNYLSTGIFNPGGPVVSTENMLEDNLSNPYASDIDTTKDATAIMPTATPGINIGGVGNAGDGSRNVQEFRSKSIEGKLDMLNNTLIGMQDKQREQDKILSALTNTPIYNYGV